MTRKKYFPGYEYTYVFEVAELAQCSSETVYTACRTGKLTARKAHAGYWKITNDEKLEAFIDKKLSR